jgi:hypothetical protein
LIESPEAYQATTVESKVKNIKYRKAINPTIQASNQ